MITDISIYNIYERSIAISIAKDIYNHRDCYPWYRNRMIFQAIDIYDRYLTHVVAGGTRKIASKYQGQYLSKLECETHFSVVLYIALKYFTTMTIPIFSMT